MEKRLIANRIKTPDGTILWSRSVHDFVAYEDTKTGERYILDGGTEYTHGSINKIPAKDVSIYSTAKWKTLRNYIIRNTLLLDSNGNQTGESGYVRLSNMSDAHLVNLKEYLELRGSGSKLVQYIKKEQAYRKKNGISIPEHDYTPELVKSIEVAK